MTLVDCPTVSNVQKLCMQKGCSGPSLTEGIPLTDASQWCNCVVVWIGLILFWYLYACAELVNKAG